MTRSSPIPSSPSPYSTASSTTPPPSTSGTRATARATAVTPAFRPLTPTRTGPRAVHSFTRVNSSTFSLPLSRVAFAGEAVHRGPVQEPHPDPRAGRGVRGDVVPVRPVERGLHRRQRPDLRRRSRVGPRLEGLHGAAQRGLEAGDPHRVLTQRFPGSGRRPGRSPPRGRPARRPPRSPRRSLGRRSGAEAPRPRARPRRGRRPPRRRARPG